MLLASESCLGGCRSSLCLQSAAVKKLQELEGLLKTQAAKSAKSAAASVGQCALISVRCPDRVGCLSSQHPARAVPLPRSLQAAPRLRNVSLPRASVLAVDPP